MDQPILCQEMLKLAWDLFIFLFFEFFELMSLASLVDQLWHHFPRMWHIVDFPRIIKRCANKIRILFIKV
jgi:aspartyl/asparaginyl beta-hydroxylase (cupin superfamily)